MTENSAISWTRHTWNPVIGCTKISPACDGCYAAHLMDTRLGQVAWGKSLKHTGRLLDGVEHNAFPEVANV